MNRCIVIALLAAVACLSNSLAAAATLPSVPGLLFRLDATDINGDGLADNLANNAVISQWDDISGTNNDAVQADPTKRPTYLLNGAFNGRPAVHFDGSNDQLAAAGTAARTVFAVNRPGSQPHILSGLIGEIGDFGIRRDVVVPSVAWRGVPGNTNLGDFTNGGQFFVNGVATDAAAENTWHVITAIGTGQGFTTTAIGDYGTGPAAGRAFSGDYAEVLIYNSALSTNDRQSIESYLQAKWFAPVPEPSTLVLLVLGAGGMALAYRRKLR